MESPGSSDLGSGSSAWNSDMDDVPLVMDDEEGNDGTPASTARSLCSERSEGAPDSYRSSQHLESPPSSSHASFDSSSSTTDDAMGPTINQPAGIRLNLQTAALLAAPVDNEKEPSRPMGVPALNIQGIVTSPSGSNGRTCKPPPLSLLVSSSASPTASPWGASKPFSRQAAAAAASVDADSSLPHLKVVLVLPAFDFYPGQQQQLCRRKPSLVGQACASSCSSAGIGQALSSGDRSSSHGASVPAVTVAASPTAGGSSCATPMFDPAAVEEALEAGLGIASSGFEYFTLNPAKLDVLLGAAQPAVAYPQQQRSSSCCGSPAVGDGIATPRPRPSQLSFAGTGSSLRASSSGGGIKHEPQTIGVAITGCEFSMPLLEETMASCDKLVAEAKAMQQQHADMEEALNREVTRQKLDAAEARGDYRRLREEYEAYKRGSENDKRRIEEEVARMEAKCAKLKQDLEKEKADHRATQGSNQHLTQMVQALMAQVAANQGPEATPRVDERHQGRQHQQQQATSRRQSLGISGRTSSCGDGAARPNFSSSGRASNDGSKVQRSSSSTDHGGSRGRRGTGEGEGPHSSSNSRRQSLGSGGGGGSSYSRTPGGMEDSGAWNRPSSGGGGNSCSSFGKQWGSNSSSSHQQKSKSRQNMRSSMDAENFAALLSRSPVSPVPSTRAEGTRRSDGPLVHGVSSPSPVPDNSTQQQRTPHHRHSSSGGGSANSRSVSASPPNPYGTARIFHAATAALLASTGGNGSGGGTGTSTGAQQAAPAAAGRLSPQPVHAGAAASAPAASAGGGGGSPGGLAISNFAAALAAAGGGRGGMASPGQKLSPHPPSGQASGSPRGLAASRPNRGMMGVRGGQGGPKAGAGQQ